MRAREFIVKEQRTDEILPVVAAAGGALAKGAMALGRGAMAAGRGVAKGVQAVGNVAGNAVSGVSKLANLAGQAGSGNTSTPQVAQGTTGAGDKLTTPPGGGQSDSQQQKQQQAQQQQAQATSTNLDNIAAQIVALKQDLLKQQQASV